MKSGQRGVRCLWRVRFEKKKSFVLRLEKKSDGSRIPVKWHFIPSVLAACTSVTDGRSTDHDTVTSVAITGAIDAFSGAAYKQFDEVALN